jgi:RHS repeat-associated protein
MCRNVLSPYPPPSYSARYTFSGKERDEETGYSYFGARYYNSSYSIWMSVDPMSDKYPSISPYVYCGNNPVKLVDANGEEWEINEAGYIREVGDRNNLKLYAVKGYSQDDFGKRKTVGYGKKRQEIFVDVDEDIMKLNTTSDANGRIESTELNVSGKNIMAQNLFRFMSKNTDVEWSYWGGNINDESVSYLSSNHSYNKDKFSPVQATSFMNNKGTLSFFFHSHPRKEPLGAFTNLIDRNFQEMCNNNNPNVIFGIMHRGKLFDMNVFKMDWSGFRR